MTKPDTDRARGDRIDEGLLPCPHCGGKEHEIGIGDAGHSVTCHSFSCRTSTGSWSTRQEAIAAWNRRASHADAAPVGFVHASYIKDMSRYESATMYREKVGPFTIPLYTAASPATPPAAGRGVTDEMVERALDAYFNDPDWRKGPHAEFINDGARAGMRAALAAAPVPPVVGEDAVERIAETMWQSEWKRAGNGGLRKVPWTEVADQDRERYRFVAREVAALTSSVPVGVKALPDNIIEDAAKAAFVKAQSVYRSDHDHFPLKSTWETTSESVRDGWRGIAHAAVEAAYLPPLGTQPGPRLPRDVAGSISPAQGWWEPTHHHKKRGTEYALLGIGKMQTEKWKTPTIKPDDDGLQRWTHVSIDMREVAIYRSVDDGSLWVRPREEFEDGRFEPLPSALAGGKDNG